MSPSSPSRSSVWSVTSAAAAEALSKNCTSSSRQSYLQGKEMEGLEPLPSTKRSASTHARAGRQAGIRNQQEYYSPLQSNFDELIPRDGRADGMGRNACECEGFLSPPPSPAAPTPIQPQLTLACQDYTRDSPPRVVRVAVHPLVRVNVICQARVRLQDRVSRSVTQRSPLLPPLSRKLAHGAMRLQIHNHSKIK